MNQKKKIKKALISAIGLSLAFLLMLSSSLGPFAQAQEAGDTLNSESASSDINSSVPESTSTEETENQETEETSSIQLETSETNSSSSSVSEVSTVSSTAPVSDSNSTSQENENQLANRNIELLPPAQFSEAEGSVIVTKDNFLEYFELHGAAQFNPSTGILQLTDKTGDGNSQSGSASLITVDGISVEENFELKGAVWLSDVGQNRPSDGMVIGFHQDARDVGSGGPYLGLGGLDQGFGFKFDTLLNGYSSGFPGMEPFYADLTIDGSKVVRPWTPQSGTASRYNVAFGGFVYNDAGNSNKTTTYVGSQDSTLTGESLDAAMLERPKWLDWDGTNSLTSRIQGEWLNFNLIYNGIDKTITITTTYDVADSNGSIVGPSFKKTVSDWLGDNSSAKFFISGGTGMYPTYQRMRIDQFTYLAKESVKFSSGTPTVANPVEKIDGLVGSEIVLDIQPPDISNKRVGYDFIKWTNIADPENPVDYQVGASYILPGAGITYTAQWTPHEYTLQFDPGNTEGTPTVTGTMADQVIQYNDDENYTGTKINESTYVKDGYTLTGWKTEVNDETVVYDASGSVKNLTDVDGATFTLVAQWTADPHTITFDMNNLYNGQPDVTTNAPDQLTYGTDSTVNLSGVGSTATREGYDLVGWYDADGNEMPQTEFKMPSKDLTYIARWEEKQYDVKFSAGSDGDTVTNMPSDYAQNYRATIATPTEIPVRTGYIFDGWLTADGQTIAQVGTTPLDGVTFEAQWSGKEYQVVFDSNQGNGATPVKGEMANQALIYGTETTLTTNAYTRDGYEFENWNTKADGTGVSYENEAAVNELTAEDSITLYAQWTALPQTITFDPAPGSTTQQTITKNTDESVDLSGVVPATRPGYTFASWEDSNNTPISTGTITMPAGGLEYHATWSENTYSIVFDGGGATKTSVDGQATMPDQKLNYEDEKALSKNIYIKDGYTFDGWIISGSDGSKVYSDEEVVKQLTTIADGKITMVAQWKANTYNVAFEGNGGNLPAPATATDQMETKTYTYDDGSQNFPKNEYIRTGYTFAGWKIKDQTDSPVYADQAQALNLATEGTITLQAQWSANSYTVKFDGNGSTGTTQNGVTEMPAQTFVYDAAQNLSENIYIKDGYTFTGWKIKADEQNAATSTLYLDKDSVLNLTTASTVTLQAQWAPNNYTVKFDPGNEDGKVQAEGSMADQAFVYDAAQNLTENAYTKDGYQFLYWTDGENTYADKASVKNLTIAKDGNVTLTAVWAANTDNIISFNANGGQTSQQNISGATDAQIDLKNVKDATRTGYTFAGWFDADDNALVKNTIIMPAGGIQYIAKWTANSYTIHFDGGDGGALPNPASPTDQMDSKTYTYDDKTKSLPNNEYVKDGYTFTGWKLKGGDTTYTNGQIVDNFATEGEITLVAQWTANNYEIQFFGNGSSGTTEEGQTTMPNQAFVYDVSQKLSTNIYQKTGYTFANWNTLATPSETTPGTSYADKAEVKNLTTTADGTFPLYAQWTANSYTVKFDGNTATGTTVSGQSSMDDQTFVYDSAKNLEENIYVKDGYSFAGWNTVKTPTQENPGQTFTDKQSVQNLVDKGNITLYAQWSAGEQSIYFNNGVDSSVTNIENMPNPIQKDTDETIVFADYITSDPTRPGYTFEGWYDALTGGNKMPDSITMPAGGKTYYARWSANETTIKFNPNGGTTSQKDITGKTDDTIDLTAIKTASRDGYTFQGWYDAPTDGSKMPDSITMPADGKEYFAQWEAITYTISFNGNDSTSGTMSSMTVAYDQANVTLTQNAFAKEGYTFTGWNTKANGKGTAYADQNAVLNWADEQDSEIELFAQWSANSYEVKFDANGDGKGTVVDTMENQSFTFDVEQKLTQNAYSISGYTFRGWTSNADGTGTIYTDAQAVKNLASTNGEVVTVYASWEADGQYVRFTAKDGDTNVTDLPDSISYETNESVTLEEPAEPSRTGYTFAGWENKEDEGTVVTFPQIFTMPAGDVIYQATWTANQYEIEFDGNGQNSDSPTMSNQVFTYDAKATALLKNEFVKDGYTFTGWNTEKNGSGTGYTDKESIQNLTTESDKTIVLYAQWTANNFTVKFNKNTGSGSMEDQIFTYDTAQQLNKNTFTKTNYTFGSWNTKADGSGITYTDEQVVSNLAGSGSITLYAQWKDTFSISANDITVKKTEIENLSQTDLEDLLISKSNAIGTVNGTGDESTVTVKTNKVVYTSGTYEVVFECNNVQTTIKVTVQEADNITVDAQEAIEANNIGIKSTQVGLISNDEYKTLASAKAWKTDFSNDSVEVFSVDASKVKATAGNYPITFATKSGTKVTAIVAVTDAENGNVENKEAIQANNIIVKLSDANSIDYVTESAAKAWTADSTQSTQLGVIADDSSVVLAVGTYPVVYKTNTSTATQVTGLVTIYDADHVNTNLAKNEAIQVNDFTFDLNDIANLTEDESISKGNPTAWSMDTLNANVGISSADLSSIKAEKGVYPIVYTADNGTTVTGYVGIGAGDVVVGNDNLKEVAQGNNFVVTGTQVANGISDADYIAKASASAFTWSSTGEMQNVDIQSVDHSAVLSSYGTYPVTYTTENGVELTTFATVQTADEITVSTDKNKAIQANNFSIKLFEVENGALTNQYCFDEADPLAWSTDGLNTSINIDLSETDFSQVKNAVGHYPVTFYTVGPEPISVTVDLEVIANNITQVTFDGNGATTDASPKVIGIEEPSTTMGSLPETDPKRVGYTFTGWNTSADGSGSVFDENSTVTQAMTVYAQWSINSYTVSFDTQGGGDNPASQTIVYNQLITKPDTDPFKKGYSFVGWFTEPTGGTYWDFSKNTMLGKDFTLYARYEVNKYVVTFNPQNGTSPFYQNVGYGYLVQNPTTPILYGYTLLGWKDSNGEYWNFEQNQMPDYDITLTAQWEHTEYTVTYVTYDLQPLASYKLYAGDKIPAQNSPYVAGHSFASWVIGGTDIAWNIYNPMPDKNLVLVATYNKVSTDPPISASTGSNPPSRSNNLTQAGSTTVINSNTTVTTSIPTTPDEISSTTSEGPNTSSTSQSVIISESDGPLAPNPDLADQETWSLLSLILTIASIIVSVISLLFCFKKGNHKLFGIIGALVGIVSIIFFFVFNHLDATMVFFNSSTLLIVATVIIQLVMLLLTHGDKKDEDDDDELNQVQQA